MLPGASWALCPSQPIDTDIVTAPTLQLCDNLDTSGRVMAPRPVCLHPAPRTHYMCDTKALFPLMESLSRFKGCLVWRITVSTPRRQHTHALPPFADVSKKDNPDTGLSVCPSLWHRCVVEMSRTSQ